MPSFFDDNLLRLYAILIGEAKFTIWLLRAKFQKKEVTAFLLKTFFIENVKRRIRLDFERMSLSKFIKIWNKPSLCKVSDGALLILI